MKEFNLDLHSSLHHKIINLKHSLLFCGFSSRKIDVYHPEIRNCLSIPFTHTHPLIIHSTASVTKKEKKKKEAVTQLEQSIQPGGKKPL